MKASDKNNFIFFYNREIHNQINFFKISIGNFNTKLSDISNKDSIFYVFGYLHDALSHASNVAKLLRDQRITDKTPEIEKDFINLRNDYVNWIKLKFPRNSIIAENVKLRNNLEHFDEKLVTFFSSLGDSSVGDMNISSPGGIVINGKDSLELDTFLRSFNPKSNEFVWRGDKYNIQELMDTLIELEKFLTDPVNQYKIV